MAKEQGYTPVEDVQRKLDRAIQNINSDLDLKDESKERMIRDVYQEARSEAIQEAQTALEDAEIEMKIARRLAFAPPVIETEGRRPDPVAVQQAYVRSYEKLEDVRDPNEILQALQKAELLNDPFMAKACLVRGYELGNSTIVGRYFDCYPDERAFWDDFTEAAEAYNELERAMSMFSASSRLRPLEQYLA
jgi:hypothetical protein